MENSYLYDAWGQTRSQTGTLVNPFGYTAREFGDAGTLFYRARYYSPNIGRFISADPLAQIAIRGYAAGQVYSPILLPDYPYATGSPIQFKDPLGLDAGGADQGPVVCIQGCVEGLNRAKFVCSVLATAGFLACATRFVICFEAAGGIGTLPCYWALTRCITAVALFHALCDSAADAAYVICVQQCRCNAR